MICTMFKSLVDTKTPYYREVNSVFELIKTGGKHGAVVDKIRTTKDKEERERLKKSLPITLFSGKFKARKAEALEVYNKLVCLDLDNLKNVDVRKFELEQLPYVFAAWVSPSGNGLKVLVKVLTDNHLGHFLALSKEIKGMDPSGKDICRATFLSKDEKIYVNPNATVYDKVLLPSFTDEQKYENLKKWLENKGSKFIDGQRNTFITKLAGAANRFGVSKDFLKSKFREEFLNNSNFTDREMEVTVNGVYERYADQHATVEANEVWTDNKIDEVLGTEIKVNDIITLSEVEEDLLKSYDEGVPPGETTYYPELDKYFRWERGEVTVLTGHAGLGKTTCGNQLLVNKAAFEGCKFGLLSTETYPPTYFYRELIRTVVGKPLEQERRDRMTKEEFKRGMDFVRAHFFYIFPESSDPTNEWALARFSEAVIKYGIDGVVKDPHNSMTHDYSSNGGRDDKYLAQMLSKDKRFALQNQLYYLIVAHPKGLGCKEDGTYKVPGLHDISGGVTWGQRVDNGLVYHRPNAPLDFSEPTATLGSIKVKKQPKNGKIGTTTFKYDWAKGRFYENNFCPLDNFKL